MWNVLYILHNLYIKKEMWTWCETIASTRVVEIDAFKYRLSYWKLKTKNNKNIFSIIVH